MLHVQTVPVASATDRSPVCQLPSPLDPAIAADMARLKQQRLADIATHPLSPTATSLESAGRPVFVLGTRNSKLAMVQTELVKKMLEERWPGQEIRISGMTTAGDKNQSQPLYLLGGKALWTKELEVAMLEGGVDAIVHSLKDVPTSFPDGCELGAVLVREDPSDALVVKTGLPYTSLDDFPDGSVIGTSSVRRVAQLRRKFPKLKFADVRGNLQTRLRKLDDPRGIYTALILASAGLIRLGLASRITASVASPVLFHAVGQGAIGVEIRSQDARAAEIIGSLEDWKTGWTTRAERSMLRVLEGGCSVPVGCETYLVEMSPPDNCPASSSSFAPSSSRSSPHAHPDHPHSATLSITGTITSLAGTSHVMATLTRDIHSIKEAEQLGAEIAEQLIASGGRAILEELGKHVKEVGGEEGAELPFESNHGIIPGMAREAANKARAKSFGEKEKRTVYIEADTCQRPNGW